MLDTAERKLVADFCRKHLALNAQWEDDEQGGYFRFRAGDSAKRLKVQGNSVGWESHRGDAEHIIEAVCSQLQMVREDGWKWVYLEAMRTGANAPEGRERFKGIPLDEEEESTALARGRQETGWDAMGRAHASVVDKLVAMNHQLVHQVSELAAERQEMALHAMGHAMQAESLLHSDRARMVAASIEAANPTLQTVLPILINAMFPASSAPLDPDQPAEPAAAAAWHFERIKLHAQGIATAVATDREALTPELRAGLGQLAEFAAQVMGAGAGGAEGSAVGSAA